jgi:hypothetical protein
MSSEIVLSVGLNLNETSPNCELTNQVKIMAQGLYSAMSQWTENLGLSPWSMNIGD